MALGERAVRGGGYGGGGGLALRAGVAGKSVSSSERAGTSVEPI